MDENEGSVAWNCLHLDIRAIILQMNREWNMAEMISIIWLRFIVARIIYLHKALTREERKRILYVVHD